MNGCGSPRSLSPCRRPANRARNQRGPFPWPPRPHRPPGSRHITLNFNSPINSGVFVVTIDGEALTEAPFDFTRKALLGIKRKGTGTVKKALIPGTQRQAHHRHPTDLCRPGHRNNGRVHGESRARSGPSASTNRQRQENPHSSSSVPTGDRVQGLRRLALPTSWWSCSSPAAREPARGLSCSCRNSASPSISGEPTAPHHQ